MCKVLGEVLKWMEICQFCGRFGDLFSAIWRFVDLYFDYNQMQDYSNYTSETGSYKKWALNNSNCQDPSKDCHLPSEWYWGVSLLIWFLPPLVYTVYGLYKNLSVEMDDNEPKFRPFKITNSTLKRISFGACEDCCPKVLFEEQPCLTLLCALPVEYAFSFIHLYLVYPLVSLVNGFNVALGSECCEPEDGILCGVRIKNLPIHSLFEDLGNALPSFCLTITFIVYHNDFVSEMDPITWANLFTSFISLMIALDEGCRRCFEIDDFEIKNQE